MMKVEDVCRIIKQPEDQKAQILGKVGFIVEIKEDYATFEALELDGSLDGVGCIPLDCLALETNPEWLRAKQLRDAYIESIRQEGLERGRRHQAKLEEIASKYSLTSKQVEEIYLEVLREFDSMRY